MHSCLYQISMLYNQLSYSEKLLADYIVANQPAVINLSIAALAKKVGIAPSTVVSTAKKLGFEGYKDLKISLATELSNSLLSHWASPESRPDGADNLFHRTVDINIEALATARASLNYGHLLLASETIRKAKRVFIMGEGTSDAFAYEAYDYFSRLGLTCIYERDWQRKMLLSSQATADDAAVLLSLTGTNVNILKIAAKLAATGCPTIGISNYKNTPFSKGVEVIIALFDELSTTHDNNFTFRIPILCVLETMYYILASRMDDGYARILNMNRQLVKEESVVKNSSR